MFSACRYARPISFTEVGAWRAKREIVSFRVARACVRAVPM